MLMVFCLTKVVKFNSYLCSELINSLTKNSYYYERVYYERYAG